MASIEKYTDLKIFQLARQLCKNVYEVTDKMPWRNDTRFVQQIHAAVGSIMDNIAEGRHKQKIEYLLRSGRGIGSDSARFE